MLDLGENFGVAGITLHEGSSCGEKTLASSEAFSFALRIPNLSIYLYRIVFDIIASFPGGVAIVIEAKELQATEFKIKHMERRKGLKPYEFRVLYFSTLR